MFLLACYHKLTYYNFILSGKFVNVNAVWQDASVKLKPVLLTFICSCVKKCCNVFAIHIENFQSSRARN